MLALLALLWFTRADGIALVALIIGGVIALGVIESKVKQAQHAAKGRAAAELAAAEDPLTALRHACRQHGAGPYLGLDDRGQLRFARPQRAVLLLGPPRSGKTSAVIIPTVLANAGAAVCTSTKPDLAAATAPARSRIGRVWSFNPTGGHAPAGLEPLRWSPISCSKGWDGALLMARAMSAQVGAGTTSQSHWATRAQALLAPFLHAAAIDGRDIECVVDWLMRHDLDEAGILLEQPQASRLAFGSLIGLFNTEPRERASIFSAAADALQAYTSEAALEAAKDPNFDAAAFTGSLDTIYIHAPADEQAAAGPLVCGLLAEIRRATYLAHRDGTRKGPVLFALDEVANIAPIEELPQIASEGGGQGLTLLAALQDLSQARGRWGAAAEGFLTPFGTKLILPGIADTRTLESISIMLGEYDRQMVATTRPAGNVLLNALAMDPGTPSRTQTTSTQRTRVLSPGEIAGIPAGRALHLDATQWELLTQTPAHASEPWKTILATTAAGR
ncbi:MAG TPA: type IV secretory system conjugative DNA transfer family protein [Solirubrobacteraceae bacterium]|nr:type IV secretory system conjugative DNA transfer family protein [Solirubrobacteraceae bacterium]